MDKTKWEYMYFRDALPIAMGKTPPRGDSDSWDVNKKTKNRWVSIADISSNEGKYIFDTKEYISDMAASKIHQAKKGSLLMSFKLSIGKMAFAGTDLYTNEAIIAIPQNDKYSLKFLYYYFISYNWSTLTDGNEKVKGATLNKKSIGEIKLPLILFPEQQEIVDYLDAAFAKIDALKKNAEQQLADAKALFSQALEEAMTPKDGWEENALKNAGKVQTGQTPSTSRKEFYGGEIPFIKPSEINYDGMGGINYTNCQKLTNLGFENTRKIEAYSVLMVCIGATISKVGFSSLTVACNQQINTFTPSSDIDYKFAYYYMSSSHFRDIVIKEGTSAQATLPIINKSKWENIHIHFPSLPEQQRIVAHLDALSTKVNQLQENYNIILRECDALKQALLREIFE